nr:testicular acid phosphatase homolog isoform X1 [Parasteatoda tepidariorum]
MFKYVSFPPYFAQLYRHGDRSPIYMYPNDPNPKGIWPEGLGALTELGKQQHRNLGKYFRNHYQDFMTSDPSEINVLSTHKSRCIQSAISNLQTFYPFNEAVEFQEQANDAQIPIFYMASAYDEILGTDVDCPRLRNEKKKAVDEKMDKLSGKFREMFEFYSYHAGDEINSWRMAVSLYDTLFIEKKHNHMIPEWADAYWSKLEEILELAHSWHTGIALRLRAGPFLKYIIENMHDKIHGISRFKFHAFSAHNVNLNIISKALSLNLSTKPPYCATLIFELYSGTTNSNFVRILYLNSTEPEKEIEEPHVLLLGDCEEFCPLEYFMKYTRYLIPLNFQEECKIPEYQQTNFPFGIIMAVFGVFILIIIAVFFRSFREMYHRLSIIKHDILHQKV